MQKSEIEHGKEYAFREKRAPGTPFQRVRIIEHIRGNKWKVEWVEPNPGLVHYAESAQLVVPWKEHKGFLKDEERAARLREHNDSMGYLKDSPVDNALVQVFECVGESVWFEHGTLSARPDVIKRIKERAKLNPEPSSPVAYVDRSGTVHLPFDEALELGQKFVAAEPSAVLIEIETSERDYEQKIRNGDTYLVSLFNEFRASWAILRQWASYDAAIAQREAQIEKLERLVLDAIYALQRAGLDKEAARLRRAIGRD